MGTIKSFTSLQQSKKLAKILPLESADMSWVSNGFGKPFARTIPIKGDPEELCGCWSLAALLEQFEDEAGFARDYGLWFCYDNRKSYCTEHYDNPIDACVELILKLNELNLL